jgi:phage gp36-like protein
MTTYATLDDLLQAATGGWEELAQRGGMSALVDGGLLAATAHGLDRSAWSLEARTAADLALVRLNDALVRASSHADTYMYPRYRVAMPLAPELVAASALPSVVAAIALKRLYGTSVPEEVRKGTQWADDYLRDLSKGVVSLGTVDATVAQPAGHVVSRVPAKAFDWALY